MKTALRRVIVNADDFGQTPGVSQGIIDSHQRGIVTSASLMVNSPYAKHGTDLQSSRAVSMALGLHFNLTAGVPVSDIVLVRSLVDDSGYFPAPFDSSILGMRIDSSQIDAQVNSVLKRLALNAKVDDIRNELWAQFDRFVSLTGMTPTHIDTHHHIHRIQNVLNAVAELAKEHRIPVRQISPSMKSFLRKKGIPTSDWFVGRFWGEPDRERALNELIRALRRSRAGITELMCHPGYADSLLRMDSMYSWQRETEVDLLSDQGVRALIDHCGVSLESPSCLH